jgi:hypothetical protein
MSAAASGVQGQDATAYFQGIGRQSVSLGYFANVHDGQHRSVGLQADVCLEGAALTVVGVDADAPHRAEVVK